MKEKKTINYIQKPNATVPCVSQVPDDAKGIVIAVHGFSSSKACGTYQMLLRRLPIAGYGMIGIDLPGHGESQEELRIQNAIDSIEAAEKAAPDLPIYYFASSFGAYLTALYISTREHRGRKAFFRSAAVNMPSLFVENQGLLKELNEKGYAEAGFETKVRIPREFYDDLAATDLFELFDPHDTEVMMVHGSQDQVIDPNAARAFSTKFQVPMVMIDGEGHSLGVRPETPDHVADLAIEFYADCSQWLKPWGSRRC